MKSEFVFLDYEESKILFYIDYLALYVLFFYKLNQKVYNTIVKEIKERKAEEICMML